MLIVPFDDDEKEELWCDILLMRWYYVSVGNAEVVLVVNSGRDVRWRIHRNVKCKPKSKTRSEERILNM